MSIWLDAAFVSWRFATINIQDFHDIEGDREAGRRTLPIALSPFEIVCLRRSTAAFLILAALAFILLGMHLCQDRSNIWVTIFAALQLLGATVAAVSLIHDSTLQASERTYKLLYIPTVLVVVAYLSLS